MGAKPQDIAGLRNQQVVVTGHEPPKGAATTMPAR